MAYAWILIGLLPSTAAGWLLLRLLEGRKAVLTALERGAAGTVLGITLAQLMTFVLHATLSLPLTRTGFVVAQAVLIAPLALLTLRMPRERAERTHVAPSPPMATRWKIVFGILGAWTAIKVLALSLTLISTPAYFDDTFDNWNYRAKIFLETQRLELILPPDTEPGGISSYPPTVPLVKTWLTSLSGGWDEGIADGVHVVWFLAALALTYAAVRRRASRAWAWTATYGLASLPLFLIHGTSAYAEVFVAAHLLVAVTPLLAAASARDSQEARSLLRVSAVAAGVLPFLKNEGLLLYGPALAVVAGLTVWMLLRHGVLSRKHGWEAAAWFAGSFVLLGGPWIAYKAVNGLVFGNAHALGAFNLGWQENVFTSIIINSFLEGNWLLLFPLLIALLAIRWKTALRTTLAIPVTFFLLSYGVQLFLYHFTSLASEARQQTGYSRGVVQLLPIMVIVGTLLLRALLQGRDGRKEE